MSSFGIIVKLSAAFCCMIMLAVCSGCAGMSAQASTIALPHSSSSPVAKEDGTWHDAGPQWQRYFEKGFIYAVGYGRVPIDKAGRNDWWARAKRAAIDNALANLAIEAERIHRVSIEGQTVSKSERKNGVTFSEALHRSLEYVEIVNIIRFNNGECRVLMRMPYPLVQEQ